MSAYVIDDVMSCVTAHRALSAASTSCACASFLCLFIAVTTDYWLYTDERLTDGNTTSPSVYLATSSGLWRKCAHKRTSLYAAICLHSFAVKFLSPNAKFFLRGRGAS